MDYKTEKKIFFRFLKECGYFENFYKNTYNKKINFMNKPGILDKYCFYEYFLSDSFVWSKSKEGEIFWCEIDDSWVTFINKLYRKIENKELIINENNLINLKKLMEKHYENYITNF